MTTQPPRVTSREKLVAGRKFDFERLTIRTPGGKELRREVVRHPGAVVIVPLLDDGRLVLIRVFRASLERPMVECCAGTLEKGEAPEACAGRELEEETGYSPGELVSLGSFYTSPGMSDELMHAYLARGLKHVGEHPEEDESISVFLTSTREALAMVECAEIQDGKSMLALLLARSKGLIPA